MILSAAMSLDLLGRKFYIYIKHKEKESKFHACDGKEHAAPEFSLDKEERVTSRRLFAKNN